MSDDLSDRSRWLAINVLPHEALIRSKLNDIRSYNLDIEDVIQETYTRMLSVPSLETIRHPKQYAVKTAKAIIIDHVRHARVVSIASAGRSDTVDVPERSATAEERLEFQEEVAAVEEALAALPEKCRMTLLLRRVEGLPQKEVAHRLGISEKMVERHMTDSIKHLIKLFGRGRKTRVQTSNRAFEIGGSDVVDKPTG
ncbi:sigma-70 family RNA polymerase sigma factor [Rhizomicrobium electricum]|jgi:RNA polymerase sigma-70 factor (ECF subfamily)|nr:sigma-70 family RNA polymerase sigma factor [Rhizomicrobium electricum]NIJ49323.1 RNA polymerase sigma-70 factor (ECF subfamily) [Rhizomicrobium electricum]